MPGGLAEATKWEEGSMVDAGTRVEANVAGSDSVEMDLMAVVVAMAVVATASAVSWAPTRAISVAIVVLRFWFDLRRLEFPRAF